MEEDHAGRSTHDLQWIMQKGMNPDNDMSSMVEGKIPKLTVQVLGTRNSMW